MTKPPSPAAGSLHGLTPRLIVKDAARAIAFYRDVLGAQEISRFADEQLGGLIVHAELRLGDATVTLAEEHVEWHNCAPPTLGGSSVILNLEVDDADALGARMVQAGSRVVFPIADQFYGKREGRLQDPFGHLWLISQKGEALSAQEIQRRIAQRL